MIEERMNITIPAVIAFAVLDAGPASAGADSVEPFFPRDYDTRRVAVERHVQKYLEAVLITGTEEYVGRVSAALELIERTDPRSWYFVRKHVRKITLTGHPGMDIGGGRFTSGAGEGVERESLAGSIVHDAWHREHYVRGDPWEGRGAEIFCLERQNAFLAMVERPPLDIDEVVATAYWETDYWSRNW